MYRNWQVEEQKRGKAVKCKCCEGYTFSPTGVCASCTVACRVDDLVAGTHGEHIAAREAKIGDTGRH
jgi:hypothetical protein